MHAHIYVQHMHIRTCILRMFGRTMMIRGLQTLDLSKNKLEELPHGVGAHKALRNLDLKENTYRPPPHTLFLVCEERASARAREREGERGG